MSNRMNVTIDDQIAEQLVKYKTQTATDSLPQVYRWMIEASVMYIEQGKISPMFKVLREINEEENDG